MNERLEAEGFLPEKDAKLYAYVAYWLHNNQNLPLPDEDKWKMILDSYGYHQYLETGDVLLEDD
jgi:hypothetical protein